MKKVMTEMFAKGVIETPLPGVMSEVSYAGKNVSGEHCQ